MIKAEIGKRIRNIATVKDTVRKICAELRN